MNLMTIKDTLGLSKKENRSVSILLTDNEIKSYLSEIGLTSDKIKKMLPQMKLAAEHLYLSDFPTLKNLYGFVCDNPLLIESFTKLGLKIKNNEFSDKKIVVFDMDGTLAKWEDNWDKSSLGANAWKQKGFFLGLSAHEEMINLAKELQKQDSYEVFVLSSVSRLENASLEKRIWLNNHLPSFKDSHILFVEDSCFKNICSCPNSNMIFFDDYKPCLNSVRGSGAITVLVNNNISKEREKGDFDLVLDAKKPFSVDTLRNYLREKDREKKYGNL